MGITTQPEQRLDKTTARAISNPNIGFFIDNSL
jgi:hypothetical protein